MRNLIVLLICLLVLTASGCSHRVVVVKTNASEKKLDSRAVQKNNIHQSDIFLAKAKEFYAKGKYKQTLKFCEKALKFNPNNWEAHYYIGLATQRNRQYAESIEALKIGLRLGPQNRIMQSDIHCNLAINYEKMGMAERARSEYQMALELNSSNQGAREGLSRIKVKKTLKGWQKERRKN
jgi:tetratricopeptide (TPR) repeat protein